MRTELQKKRQIIVVLSCYIVVSLCLQVMKFYLFPAKYFSDADTIQQFMRGQKNPLLGISYLNTAEILLAINQILPMDSQIFGGLVIWAVMLFPCIWIVLQYIQNTWEHYFLIAAYSVLLPVFVWNTHKETLQFMFFLLIALIALSTKQENVKTDTMLISLLILWSFVFRSYYIIIAVGTAGLMILDRLLHSECKERVKVGVVCFLVFGFFAFLIALKSFAPEKLHTLFNGRMGVNEWRMGDGNANTIIVDLLSNPQRKIVLYLLNYIISALRMMLPFELLFKGIKYVPFIVLQLFWTLWLIKAVKEFVKGQWYKKPEKRLLFITLSWYLVAFLFEPDFGSFVRHQSAAFPIMLPVLFTT